jgi:hypothetical protein
VENGASAGMTQLVVALDVWFAVVQQGRHYRNCKKQWAVLVVWFASFLVSLFHYSRE